MKGESKLESEITLKAKEQIEETKTKLEQIRQARIKIIQEQAGADERSESMKSGLPALLAARALSQATDGEVAALKQDISDLDASIQEAKLILQGLEAMEQPLHNSMREPRRIMKKAEKYRQIRESLEAGLTDYRLDELKLLAE